MSAIEDLSALLDKTEVIKQVYRSLRQEPAHILRDICAESIRTGKPVPDHRLHSTGYLGETSLRSLIAAGLVKQAQGRFSLYEFEPTEEGRKQYEKLIADHAFDKTPGP